MIYTHQTKYTLFFACTTIACLLLDLGQFFLKGTIIIPFLLCIYCTLLLHDTQPPYLTRSSSSKNRSERGKTSPFTKTTKPRSENWRMHISIIALLQCLEFFCFYNFFSIACIFLIPTTILAVFLKKHLYPSIANIITLTLASSIVQIYGAEGYLLPTWPTMTYTIIRISATLLITICFSLTITVWGMQDNRA